MFPTKASDQKKQVEEVAPVTDPVNEAVEMILPRGMRKMFYIDPATGKRRVEPLFVFKAFLLILVFCAVITIFRDQELLSTVGVIFSMAFASVVVGLGSQYVPMKISMTADSYVYSIQLIIRSLKLEYSKQRRSWSTLECVRFKRADTVSESVVMLYGHCDCLVFDWRVEKPWRRQLPKTTYINLWSLTPAQREDLFTCLSRFVPQEVLAPEVLYLQVKTLSGSGTSDLNDYTQVWLDEYNRHFEISNYVTLPPGSKCGDGRFSISMTIAAKVNSSTYLAVTSSGDKVIIKELVAPNDSDDAMQKKLLEQFNREAAILAKLNHPSIVSVIDHFIEGGRSYIVMECAKGRNIREHVRLQGFLPEHEVIKIAQHLASVLQYLHHHTPAILHRDFTPDNLMYGQDGSVTVIDFGAANVYNTGKTATLIGKQSYMPPEQLRGKPSPASDIYAFGATLSYLLTGKDLPGMGKLPPSVEANASKELVSLMQQCTTLTPEDRPSCDAILAILDTIKLPSTSLQT